MMYSSLHSYRLGILVGTLCLVASADSISPVYVSLGPVPVTGTSYAGYTTNAQNAVSDGGANIGNINTSPTAYNTFSSISSADMTFDTDFSNFRGVANPPAPFDNELGSAVYFSVVLKAAPGTNGISLSQITYTENDNDTVAPDYFAFAGSFATSNYAADKVGILADGTQVTGGASGSTLVNEIILTDVGVAFDATGQYSGTPQQQLDEAVADENTLGAYTLTTCFADAVDGLSSCGNVNVNTPEPGTFAFIGLGLLTALPLAYRRLRSSGREHVA